MAHKEACQVYIEQEIKEGLAQGKTPYSIGKELTAMIERLFEVSIPSTTLEKRAERIKNPTNVGKSVTTINHSESPQKPVNQGVRSPLAGPGRSPKFNKPIVPASKPQPYTNAVYIADIAISQLERITPDDTKREEAFQKVINWINKQRRKP
jgi:hypothetical protein